MSLHTLANHLQSAGRGEDKVLVHMTPAEVGGLQSLAKAHGGSLTINPKTGLPEAGFLSSLLPMIAGIALAPMTAGTSLALLGSPMGAALTVGGITALTSGSLQKGLMAGLGAYGGAGIGAGLTSMGTAAAQNAVAPSAANEAMKTMMPKTGAGIFANPTLPTVAATPAATAVAPTATMAGSTPLTTATNLTAGAPSTIQMPPSVVTPQTINAMPQAAGQAYMPSNPTMPTTALNTSDMTTGILSPREAAEQALKVAPPQTAMEKLTAGAKRATSGWDGLKELYAKSNEAAPYSGLASLGTLAMGLRGDQNGITPQEQTAMIRPYEFSREQRPEAYDIGAPMWSETPGSSRERLYFNDQYTALPIYKAPGPEYMAEGGLAAAAGGPIEQMSAMNAIGSNTGYPMAGINTPMYSNPMIQRPEATNVIASSADAGVGAYTGEARFAGGGISHLGDYSDGGRLLKGPGDGVSDSIPAVIGNKQPARLANNEFVIPARIVSEIGNGSTDAGAKKLYAMMDRVQKRRSKTVGKDKVAVDSKAYKELDRL